MHSAILALALSYLTFTSGTPLEARAPCLPNFGGPPGLSIVNKLNNVEWGPAASPQPGVAVTVQSVTSNPEFRVEFTGQPNNDFLIKPINFPELRVAAQGGALEIVTPASTDRSQSWFISCNTCTPPSAAGCIIQSASTGECVQASSSSLSLASCTALDDQLFTIS